MEIAIGVILIVALFWIMPTLIRIEKEITKIGADKKTSFKSVARIELLEELHTMRENGNLTVESLEKCIRNLKDRKIL